MHMSDDFLSEFKWKLKWAAFQIDVKITHIFQNVSSFRQSFADCIGKLLLNYVTFEKLNKGIMCHCFGVRVVANFLNKPTFLNGQKTGKIEQTWA